MLAEPEQQKLQYCNEKQLGLISDKKLNEDVKGSQLFQHVTTSVF